MENKKKNKSIFKAVKVIIPIMCFFVATIIFTSNIQEFINNPFDMKGWHNNALADHDPTGDMGGYIYFVTYPHSATPATTYASNLSMATAYEEHDIIDSELNNETPHSTTFDYVLKFRVNDTTSYNTSSSLWMPSWIHANITVDHDFAADVAWVNLSLVEIANSTDFAWYHGYINNAHVGYQITNNEKFNATVNVTLYW